MAETAPRPSEWLGSMRIRILAVVVVLLLLSSVGSVVLLRTALFQRNDEEITAQLEREIDEFRLLSTGNDPRTGQPFDGDLRAVFDVYFAREVPDEGESLMTFLDGSPHPPRRRRTRWPTRSRTGPRCSSARAASSTPPGERLAT